VFAKILTMKTMTARIFVYLVLCVGGDLAAAQTASTSSGVLTFSTDPAESTVRFTLGVAAQEHKRSGPKTSAVSGPD
jgi:hypothetical protein